MLVVVVVLVVFIVVGPALLEILLVRIVLAIRNLLQAELVIGF